MKHQSIGTDGLQKKASYRKDRIKDGALDLRRWTTTIKAEGQMNAIKEYVVVFLFSLVVFGAGYYAGARSRDAEVAQLNADMGRLRQSLDAAIARSAEAERGLAEAIGTIGTIKDTNRRITILIDTIRATIKQLRSIVESGTKVTKELGDRSEN